MAVSSKVEEILLEITKNIGNISDYLRQGIGNIEIPNSAIFELYNLKYTAETGYPYFGIVETSPLGFIASYGATTDPYNVSFTNATVAYNGNILEVKEQKIPIKKDFLKDYSLEIDPSNFKYGITVGLSIDEIKKSSQVFNTTVSELSSIGSSILYISSNTEAKSVGFPLEANIGNYYIKFSGLNLEGTGLYVDSSYYNGAGYGTLPSSFIAGSNVKLIFNPKLSYVTGFPIETTEEDPINFNYYPPMPSKWIPVAKILVERPNNPIVSGLNNDAIIRTVIDMPSSTSDNLIFGNTDDVSEVVNAVNSTIKNLNTYKNSYGLQSFINSVIQYTTKLTADQDYSFNKYWSLQPFRPTQYYSKGLSFSGLERFEFPENFGKSFYDFTGSDIQHTFAIFRGDLVKYNPAVLSTASVGSTNINLNILNDEKDSSGLSQGTQIYGISAVVNIEGDKYLETTPSYVSTNSTDYTNNRFYSELQWSGVGVTNSLFFNIYKKQSTLSEVIDKKLSKSNEIIYAPLVNTNLNSENNSVNLSTRTTAFNISPGQNCFIGGLTVKMGYDAPNQSSLGNSQLSFRVYKDSSGNPDINYALTNYFYFPYSNLKNGFSDITIKFDNGFNVTSTESIWLVIDRPSDLTVGTGSTSIKIKTDSSTAVNYKTSTTYFNGVNTWTTVLGGLFAKYRGFIDDGNVSGSEIQRGIKLTGRVANIPRRISVYVPPIDDITDNTGLLFNGSSVAIASTTDKSIKNELIVTVSAKNGLSGVEKTLSVTVPQGTLRDTRFTLGSETDKFDRITHVSVSPGSNVRRINNGPIMWDIYDLITVETQP